MDLDHLTGPEKAAVLILSVAPGAARDLLQRLGDEEVERIMAAIARIDEVPKPLRELVLDEFAQSVGQEESAILGGRDRALEIIEQTLEEARAAKIREHLGRVERSIDSTLSAFEPAFVADALAVEHPQTLALLLSQLPTSCGASIIGSLPDDQRADVVLRLADLDSVSPEVIAELEEGVAEVFGGPLGSARRVGGRDVAAQLLNQVGVEGGEAILEAVDRSNAELAVEIRRRMLTFDDLAQIDDREFQLLLREVSSEDLVVALKAASDRMRERVFKNMSARAAQQVREDVEMLGPMKLSDVEAIQEKIVETARSLANDGTIHLPIGGADDVLV